MTRLACVSVLLLLLAAGGVEVWAQMPSWEASPASNQDVPEQLRWLQPRIVNGKPTGERYGVAALLVSEFSAQTCSATLIGCRTLLTAAHCMCRGAATCTPENRRQPGYFKVFLQHAGFFDVVRITPHPDYQFAVRSDVAVFELDRDVEGIRPYRIQRGSRPGPGQLGLIVGFGRVSQPADGGGMKRDGLVRLIACDPQVTNPSTHLCWNFQAPVGAPGQDSNTCFGDSGGPLFVNVASDERLTVAGVTSGGTTDDCLQPTMGYQADVAFDANWITSTARGDLGTEVCGDLPAAGSSDFRLAVQRGSLAPNNLQDKFRVDVEPGTQRLRFGLDGVDGDSANPINYDLYVKRGDDVSTGDFDCLSSNARVYEFCEFEDPEPGIWTAMVRRRTGAGDYQLVASAFLGGEAPVPLPTECVPDAKTLCLDDEAGDRRFLVRVKYDTTLDGGRSGDASVVPLSNIGIDQGGIFAFFNATNPEMLVKMIDGCANNGRFWVFFAATTTAGFELRIVDTVAGVEKTYTNPDLTAAVPVTDAAAFATCN